jgi:hypothetical protein
VSHRSGNWPTPCAGVAVVQLLPHQLNPYTMALVLPYRASGAMLANCARSLAARSRRRQNKADLMSSLPRLAFHAEELS